MLSDAKQRHNQINAFTQNTINKTEQKITNAFANILKKNMHNTNNQYQQQEFQQAQMSQQSRLIQQTLQEVDFDLLSKNSSSKQQRQYQQSGIKNINDINFEYTQSQQAPIPKRIVKKSGKRQSFAQQKQVQANKIGKPNFLKNKANNQIDASELLRIKPEIKIYQNQRLKQSIAKSMAEENIQLKEVDFALEIPIGNYSDGMVTNLNPFNKLSEQQSKLQSRQDIHELLQSTVNQVKQMKQSKQKVKNKAKSNLKNNDDVEQIQPFQMKQSKIKNSINRQMILKASMTSEKQFDTTKGDQDLYTRNNRKIVNLAQVSLKDLVKELFLKKIINEGLYKQFMQNHSINHLKDYIKKFDSLKLHQFDFKNIKFTILDHRKIAELLANLHSDRYVIGETFHSDPQINSFLWKLYELDAQQYYNLYKKIDNISGLKWWSKILITQDERLMQLNKERRMNRRKGEQASLAIQELIQNAKKKATDNSLGESYAQSNQKGSHSSVYSDHTTFFGQSEEQKIFHQKRRQQIRELAQIRQLVSNNFCTKTNQNQQSENSKPTMRKKIRFY